MKRPKDYLTNLRQRTSRERTLPRIPRPPVKAVATPPTQKFKLWRIWENLFWTCRHCTRKNWLVDKWQVDMMIWQLPKLANFPCQDLQKTLFKRYQSGSMKLCEKEEFQPEQFEDCHWWWTGRTEQTRFPGYFSLLLKSVLKNFFHFKRLQYIVSRTFPSYLIFSLCVPIL